jgi:hypothetical protein
MKNSICVSSFAALALFSHAALAQPSVSTNISVSGNVAQACQVDGSFDNNLNIGNGLSDGFGNVDTTPRTHPVGVVTCNYAAFVNVRTTRGSLKTDANQSCNFPSNSAFHNCIKYSANAQWDGVIATVEASGDSAAGTHGTPEQTEGAHSGMLTLEIIPIDSDKPVLAGQGYADTVFIQVGATL